MNRFIPIDRQSDYLFPPSVEEWLPEKHLARFVVDVIDQMDLSALTRAYAGKGSAAHHPSVLLGVLVYGYATGVFSSRKIERATYDSVAFRYIAANTHPDHDTLATFRKRFLPQVEGLFVQILLLAAEMKLLKLGNIALDGTKVKANASKHSALSYGHSQKLEQQLKEEVRKLLAMAETADNEAVPDGMSLPEEIIRREDRLSAIAAAKVKIEARANERFEQETAVVQAKLNKRAAKSKETGKPPRGKPPAPPQVGKVNALVADTGFYSEANVNACAANEIIPLIAVSREEHHPDPLKRFTQPPPLGACATAVDAMRHRLKTKEGRGLYAQRKCTVEPVIGIVKSVLGFRQFLLRGLDNVKGEWDLVALAWNLKRMYVLTG